MQRKKQTFSLIDHLKKDDWIDAKDKDGVFRLARVLSIDDKQVSIRFEDLEEYRRDSKLYIESPRIAPLRRHTVGYTGPKYPNRDVNVDLVRLGQLMSGMTALLGDVGNEGMSAYEITQFLRGKLYMTVEKTLSFPRDVLNKPELKEMVGFLEAFVKFAVDFNNKCIKMMDSCSEELANNKQSYLVNPRVAQVAALTQVYYCVQLILQVKGELRNKFYKVITQREIRFKSIFIETKGPERLLKTLEYKDSAGKGLPAIIRIHAMILLHNCNAKFVMPSFDVRDHAELPKMFPLMLELYPSQQMQSDIIEYSLKLMSGQNNFETRLKGLNELKSNLQSIKSRDLDTIDFKKTSEDKFLSLLKSSEFFDSLLNKKTFNPEIFKRSVPILKFLSEKRSFGNTEIKHIFAIAEGKHESDKRLIYDTVSELAAFSPMDILDSLWSQLVKLPLDEGSIELLQNFTTKAVHNISCQSSIFDIFRKRKSSAKYDLYAVNHFWDEIQDKTSLTDVSIILSVLASLKQMLNQQTLNYARDMYIQECVNNLKKKYSIGQSLRLLIDIIMTYSVESYMMGGDSRHEVIQKLDKRHRLLDLLFNAVKGGDCGKLGYTLTIQYLFQFLEGFNNSLRVGLKIQEIMSLWKLEYNLSPMLAFLKKPRVSKYNQKLEYEDKYYKKLSDSLIKELMENIFLKEKMMNGFNITDELFETVDELFLSMHISLKNIRFKDKSLIRVNGLKPLDGVAFYYNLIYSNRSPSSVISKAIKRYVGLNCRTIEPNTDQQVRLWTAFLDQMVGNIEMDPAMANQFIPVIAEFFQGIEGLKYRSNILDKSNVDIKVFHKDGEVTINLVRQSTLFRLHKLIQEKLPQLKNFKMALTEGEKVITFAEEEDFSVKSLQSKNNSVRIELVDKDQFQDALRQFKCQVSRTKIHDTLLGLLNVGTTQQDLVWNLLQILPRNRALIEKLKNSKQTQKGWPKFFGDKVELLCYKLKLVHELIQDENWLSDFVLGSGLNCLVERICKANVVVVEKEMKCLLQLINILLACMNSKFQRQTMNSINKRTLVTQLCSKLMVFLKQKSAKYTNRLRNSILELILKTLNENTELVSVLSESKGLIEVLSTTGVELGDDSETFIQHFKILFQTYLNCSDQQRIILGLVSALARKVKLNPKFFDLLCNCFGGFKDQNYLTTRPEIASFLQEFCNNAFDLVQSSQPPLENDQMLYGAFKLQQLLIEKSAVDGKQKQLAYRLVSDYLLPEKGGVRLRLSVSLNQYYSLLVLLMSRHPEHKEDLYNRLKDKLKTYQKSTGRVEYQIERLPKKRFCGLRNLRATCYVNSLIQQLYMITPFREAIIRQDSSKYRQNPKQNEIFQFQKLLSYLKGSKKGSYNPREFLETFKDFDNNPIDVSIQGDVDEFYNALMQKLETFLKANNSTNIIEDVFAGQLSNQLICQSNHKGESFQHCTSIGLNIKNKPSLEEALQGYVQGEILEGDNAYFCEGCKEKVKTVKRICVKTLPNVLIIVLKRFQFNYDTMKKFKVNDYCSFPFDLNMKKYTSEYLNNPESANFLPEQYYEFKLRGVVVHYGSSEAGHYYSYIKEADQWFEFNDEHVTSFNPSFMQAETFGGTQTFGQDLEYKTERCKNAYMLFYQRSKFFSPNLDPIPQMVQYPPSTTQLQSLNSLVEIDNSNYQFMSIVYDMNFLTFTSQLILSSSHSVKLGSLVFHSILMKTRHKQEIIVGMGTRLQELLAKDQEAARWYLDQHNLGITRQYLIDAGTTYKYVCTGLLCTAIRRLKDIPRRSILMFMSFLDRKGMTPFCRVFSQISRNPRGKDVLIELKYPERVVDLIAQESPSFKPIEFQDWSTQFIQTPVPEKSPQRLARYSAPVESLQNFNLSTTELVMILPQMSVQSSIDTIARMAVRTTKTLAQEQQLMQTVQSNIINGDERQIKYYSPWWRELLLKGPTNQRMSLVIQSQLKCFESFYKTYVPFNSLLKQVFRLGLSIPGYRSHIQKQLSDNQRVLKLIEAWIGKCHNAYSLIVMDEWTTYKKRTASKLDTETSSYYKDRKEEIEASWKQLNSKEQPKAQGQKVVSTEEELVSGDGQKWILYPKINSQKVKARIQGKVGLLYQVWIQKGMNKHYWFVGDSEELQFFPSL